MNDHDDKIRATKLETLGAWLGLWTPPRGVAVPPVPWRTVGLLAVALTVIGAIGAVTIAPAIDRAKDEGQAERQRELDQRAAERRDRLEEMQEPRFGRFPGATRTQLVIKRLGVAIGEDARERFSPKARPATCEVAPGVNPERRQVAYNCLSATTEIEGAAEQKGARGTLGYPYRAIVDFQRKRYAFCRINPQPSEKALRDPRKVVGLPEPCLLQPLKTP